MIFVEVFFHIHGLSAELFIKNKFLSNKLPNQFSSQEWIFFYFLTIYLILSSEKLIKVINSYFAFCIFPNNISAISCNPLKAEFNMHLGWPMPSFQLLAA